MQSLRRLYRIGQGPSSSHTMAPRRAAQVMQKAFPQARHYEVTLYGSLAATGKGHLTDLILTDTLAPCSVHLVWQPDQLLPDHPNGMRFVAFDACQRCLGDQLFYSLVGGALNTDAPLDIRYSETSMNDILKACQSQDQPFWKYAVQVEGPELWPFLQEIWMAMQQAITKGCKRKDTCPVN